MDNDDKAAMNKTCASIVSYLAKVQDTGPGEYYGSFWSEKGYHGPLLDYHAGGSHHHRAAGSAALALWHVGRTRGDTSLQRQGEIAFDWLAARQAPRGGYPEIQNNECHADWEQTGLEELSTIAMGFVAHGLGNALLHGLPPKKSYMDCLLKAGHWQLSIEWPAGSGIFPHHERSPYDTLNANLHAAETLALAYTALANVYDQRLNIFLQGACRSVAHTLDVQDDNGCFPYRTNGGITINYTSLVLWCLLNILDVLPEHVRPLLASEERRIKGMARAAEFLRSCVGQDGQLLWEDNETSTAKYNMWTYLITTNVLLRIGGDANNAAATRLWHFACTKRTPSGLLPMRDRGENITTCAFMQADMLLFLLPFGAE